MPRIRTTALSLGTILKWVLVLGVIIALACYAFFQARYLIAGPSLTLDPLASSLTERVVAITGQAQNVTTITLNGRPIFTDDAGNFREGLVLEEGYTIITVRAEDRYGREVMLTRELVYTPAYGS